MISPDLRHAANSLRSLVPKHGSVNNFFWSRSVIIRHAQRRSAAFISNHTKLRRDCSCSGRAHSHLHPGSHDAFSGPVFPENNIESLKCNPASWSQLLADPVVCFFLTKIGEMTAQFFSQRSVSNRWFPNKKFSNPAMLRHVCDAQYLRE